MFILLKSRKFHRIVIINQAQLLSRMNLISSSNKRSSLERILGLEHKFLSRVTDNFSFEEEAFYSLALEYQETKCLASNNRSARSMKTSGQDVALWEQCRNEPSPDHPPHLFVLKV